MRKLVQSRHLFYRFARHLRWRLRGANFALAKSTEKFDHTWAEYSCPVVNHPTQKDLVAIKVANMQKATREIDGLILQPGEIFSFWRIIGRPSARAGFGSGPTFVDGRLETSVGGGLCQISGLLFNLALEAGLEILERHSHSLDAYGERRYLPLGRDATVAWMSKDLAFRNSTPFPVQIRVEAQMERASGQIKSLVPHPFDIEFEQRSETAPAGSSTMIQAALTRHVKSGSAPTFSQEFESLYRTL